MNPIIIAIDPGASGGIVVQYETGDINPIAMPATGGDIVEFLEAVRQHATLDGLRVVACVEQVGGYVGGAGQPGSAMFKFGQNYGFLLGALAAFRIPVKLVRPQAWQQFHSLGTVKGHGGKGPWKRHLKDSAQRLYPDQVVTLSTADALLILSYAQKNLS